MAFTSWKALDLRTRAVEDAKRTVETIAHALDENTARVIDSADLLTRVLATQIELLGSGEGYGSLWAMASELISDLPHLSAFTVLDPDTGRELFRFSRSYPSAPALVDDALSASRKDPSQGLYLTPPVRESTSGAWFVGLSRRVSTKARGPDLLVVAHLSVSYFQKLYDDLELGPEGAISLYRNDGVLLVRRQMLQNDAVDPHRAVVERPSHSSRQAAYEAVGEDGAVRFISYRQIDNAPVTIITSLAMDDILAGWRGQVRRDVIVALASIAVLLLLTSWLSASVRRRDLAEETLRATLDHMDQGLLMIDERGIVQIHNKRVLELLDLPRVLLDSKPTFASVLHAQMLRGDFAGSSEEPPSWDGGTSGSDVSERHRPDGRVLELRTVPLAGGGAVRTYTDVTARRKAERALAESEARYRLLADNTMDVIVRSDLSATRRYVSPAVVEMLGYEPEELIGGTPAGFVHPDDLEAEEAKRQALARGEVDRVTSTHRFRHKDGSWIWVETNFRLIRNEAGEPQEVVALVRDITARHLQAQELREAKEIAEQASQAKTDFLASMSHEIRTPLNGILGYTDLLLADPQLRPDQRQYLERIEGGGTALLAIVNDVLDLSKIEAGQIELEPEPFSLEALTESAVSIIRSLVDRKHLSLRVVVDDQLPASVIGDPDRLRQVLLNLLNNAVKFTPAGSITLEIRCIEADEERAVVCFSVEDTGLGIAEDKMERLFQRFSQADGSVRREFGGTGLGLAISKRLVELMEGRIGVDSRLGRGSRFWFTVPFPRAQEVLQPDVADAAVQRRGRRSARILLVDDNEVNQEIARAVLEAAGHSVTVVSDGTDSVLAVQARPYDVVLMDIQMPVMDGMTATQYIRALDAPCKDVAIIAMTANVLPQQVRAFREAGMNDHVGKPFKQDELLAAIDRCLGNDVAAEDAVVQDGPKAVLDRAAYREVLDAVGADAMNRLLDRLVEQLEGHLSDERLSFSDRTLLAQDAHLLVSAAGALGFVSLSEMCRDLERACESGSDIKQVLAELREARQKTLEEIVALRTAA